MQKDIVSQEGLNAGRQTIRAGRRDATGPPYLNVRDVCKGCGLNFLTEQETIRTSRLLAGKFVDIYKAPFEMWVESTAIHIWLGKAPIEPDSDFSRQAGEIIRLCEPKSQIVVSQSVVSDDDFIELLYKQRQQDKINHRLQIAARDETIAQKDIAIAQLESTSDTLKVLSHMNDGAMCLTDAAKVLCVSRKTLTDLIENKLGWGYRRLYDGGRPGPLLVKAEFGCEGKGRGFVRPHVWGKLANGYTAKEPQLRIMPKGIEYLQKHFSEKYQ
jgi:hypothetical protein